MLVVSTTHAITLELDHLLIRFSFIDLCIPFNSADFIISTSESLSNSETHLTLEFLNECILGYNRSSAEPSRQIITLEYMVPWLKNLVLFTHVPNGKEPSKVKDVIRSLIVITAEKSEVIYNHGNEHSYKACIKLTHSLYK